MPAMWRRRKTRFGLALIALVALTLPFGPWSASAHTKVYHSEVSIRYSSTSDTFSGKVTGKPECREFRTVRVRRQQSGPDPVVGTDQSDSKGRWGPLPAPGPGLYYAAIRQRAATGYGQHRHGCTSDRSTNVRVPT